MQKSHFVAIGANLFGADGASPHQICTRAVAAIAAWRDISAPVQSPWYSTGPVPASDQPRYINGLLRFRAEIDPETLLTRLQQLEQAFGRVRGAANAARTLDLDIVDSAGLVRATPDPILPHPRAHLRAFVLLPLRDLAPDWTHPATGQSVATLLANLPPQDIRRL